MKELPKDQENLAESFRSYLRKKNMSENTGDAYRRTIRQLLSIYPIPTESLLRKYRSLLIANYRPATINQRIYAVNHFLLFLEEEQPELSPDLSGFRLHSVKIPRDTFQDSIITNEDCETLQRNLKAEHRDFWYFIVRFLVTTGARVSELVQIKAEHLVCGYLDLYSKGGKIRRIYIPDSLCQEAKTWCDCRGIMQSGTASIPIPCTRIPSATGSQKIFCPEAAISLYWRIFSGMRASRPPASTSHVPARNRNSCWTRW